MFGLRDSCVGCEVRARATCDRLQLPSDQENFTNEPTSAQLAVAIGKCGQLLANPHLDNAFSLLGSQTDEAQERSAHT